MADAGEGGARKAAVVVVVVGAGRHYQGRQLAPSSVTFKPHFPYKCYSSLPHPEPCPATTSFHTNLAYSSQEPLPLLPSLSFLAPRG
ncbi:hypothetical protein E2C01_027409 [Portunus trituberculatus]|uniref:Uncharacterized protein n=1 Tax=Portunus trituberculatus TaxID=210409 RepID=A0A5B7ELH0_PORTR|nr:hypothetical protein [Portunus trituberculatus]